MNQKMFEIDLASEAHSVLLEASQQTKRKNDMTNATQTLATKNEDWGFWGTMNEHATAAWPIASTAIATATGCEPEPVSYTHLDVYKRQLPHRAARRHPGLFW